MTTQTGAPSWLELGTFDQDSATAFYGRLFGWTVDTPVPEIGDYRVFRLGGKRVAGMNPGITTDGWQVLLATPDAVETAARAELAGGTIEQLPGEFGGFGLRTDLVDPAGARIGALQPTADDLLEVQGVPGAPCWYELHSQAFDAEVRFFQEVFDWTVESIGDSDEFRMVTFPEGAGDDALAGIYDATIDPLSPVSAWQVYFAVEDADQTATQVEALGGAVISEPEDSPYGRLARVVDPLGVPFSIMRLPG
jgi:predicted enzyme related to lactoylglutathione lyase